MHVHNQLPDTICAWNLQLKDVAEVARSDRMLTTAPTVMTASKLPLLAIALATTGISKLPGTQATCMCSPGSQAICGQHPRLAIGFREC